MMRPVSSVRKHGQQKTGKIAGQAAPEPRSGDVALLSGGNLQIPKSYGDEPVQVYIAAMPGVRKTVK